MSAEDPVLLIRNLAERIAVVEGLVSKQDAVVREQIDGIREDLSRLESSVAESPHRFVSVDRYGPVERLVYGVTAAILLTVVGAVLALIIRGSS